MKKKEINDRFETGQREMCRHIAMEDGRGGGRVVEEPKGNIKEMETGMLERRERWDGRIAGTQG